MNYIQIKFQDLKQSESEILVALLSDAGFESFEETENSLVACINEADFNDSSLQEIVQMVSATYSTTQMPRQNWNEAWERSFEPILVTDFVAIRAGFHAPVPGVKHEIVITPKMSFGTGHHATTYMMIQQMETLDFAGKTVLDFGTGTAVLAILAEKMGASYTDAIDYDEWSIENSIENIAANGCIAINPVKADSICTNKQYDIILANINLNVILDNLEAIKTAGKKDSYVLLSGFMKADEPIITDALKQAGMALHKTLQKGDWICLLAQLL